jgi:DeoR/GlpR family transcriptional regulator of sugar metabolism
MAGMTAADFGGGDAMEPEDMGAILKRLRTKTPGRSQGEVAAALSIKARSLTALWETNKRAPTPDQLQRLIDYYKPNPTEEAALRAAVQRWRETRGQGRLEKTEEQSGLGLDEIAFAMTKDSKVGGRLRQNQATKTVIAQYAVDRFVASPNGVRIGHNFVITDGSTGVYLMRAIIARNPRVTIKTNSILIAYQYAWANPHEMKLEIVGGEVDREYGGVFGDEADKMIARWAVEADTNFLLVTGVSKDGIEAGSPLARRIKRQVMASLKASERSDERNVVVLADWTKLASSVGKRSEDDSELVDDDLWKTAVEHPRFFIVTAKPPAGTSGLEIAKYEAKAEGLRTLLKERFIE